MFEVEYTVSGSHPKTKDPHNQRTTMDQLEMDWGIDFLAETGAVGNNWVEIKY